MTRKEREEVVKDAEAPYTLECCGGDVEAEWSPHSRIQTTEDERVFIRHANPLLNYRVQA